MGLSMGMMIAGWDKRVSAPAYQETHWYETKKVHYQRTTPSYTVWPNSFIQFTSS
jgi:hypothetical protein